MKKTVYLLLLLLLVSCGSKKQNEVSANFEEVIKNGSNSTVRFVMWGGSSAVNKWVDTYVAPEVKKKYNITLVRVPADASVFVNKLLSEKNAGSVKGSMDIIWINGENFKNAKENGLLWGPVAEKLPNFTAFVDPETVKYDFGFPVEGYEVPYGRAQFVFVYDSAKLTDIPDSYEKLSKWVKNNPGKFTYPQPPDFTASAFIRQVFYSETGGHKQYEGKFDKTVFDQKKSEWLKYLTELSPYLWNNGANYPKDIAALDTLFERGEVLINMNYNQADAQNRILAGRYPATVKTFVMREGSIYNTHFTAIPFNAANKEGAMVVLNFLLSPEAQLSKNDPSNWGDFTVLDLKKLSKDDRRKFETLDLGASTLPLDVLGKRAVPEVASEYVEALEKEWEKAFSNK
jgi:putative spermidine/putrescine transport system substrate-binding protein